MTEEAAARDANRVITFGDAVVAIAITLLALDAVGPVATDRRPAETVPGSGRLSALSGLARLGLARLGLARLGLARLGLGWLGLAWSGRGESGQGRVEDRLAVFGGAGDLGDGDHQIEDLAEVEVAGDLVRGLGGGEQRLAGREHPAAGVEDGVGSVAVLDQPDDDRPLGGDVLKKPAQPAREPVLGAGGLTALALGLSSTSRWARAAADRNGQRLAAEPIPDAPGEPLRS